MKITKSHLLKIIREELSHSSLGAGRTPEEVFASASESLMQAHKDLQMLSVHLKNAAFDVQPTEDLIKSVEQATLSLEDLVKQDVQDLISRGSQ